MIAAIAVTAMTLITIGAIGRIVLVYLSGLTQNELIDYMNMLLETLHNQGYYINNSYVARMGECADQAEAHELYTAFIKLNSQA